MTVSKPCKMLYLIDTRNGNAQLVSRNPITVVYADSWIAQVKDNTPWFGEAESQNKIVVMTYAKFGVLAEKYPHFGYNFELILCDEIHSLPKFCGFADKNGKSNPHKSAQTRLEEIVLNGEQMVIALSATPDRAKNQIRCPFNTIPVDKEVRRLETAEIIPYTNKMNLLEKLSPNQKGIVFFTQVSDMISYQKAAESKGFRAICIWSENNLDHPMDPAQKDAIKYILSNEELPPEYDMIILNASSETSINIYGQVDYIVVHSQQEETQIQIRGRYRQDLSRLYVLDYYSAQVPDEFLDRKLFAEDKRALCEALSIRD